MSSTDPAFRAGPITVAPTPSTIGPVDTRPFVTIGGQAIWPEGRQELPPAKASQSSAAGVAIARVAMTERLRATAALRNRRQPPVFLRCADKNRPWLALSTLLIFTVAILLVIRVCTGGKKGWLFVRRKHCDKLC
jgi:hypothetical protein